MTAAGWVEPFPLALPRRQEKVKLLPVVEAPAAIADLVAGSGIAFDERGPHELRGIPGEWSLYAVRS